MSIGDQADMLRRINNYIPPWFGADNPNLQTYLTGAAALASFIYSLQQYAVLQTRIATSTDIFLDLINDDFLGGRFPRKKNENDDTYRHRLQAFIFALRNVKKAYIRILEDLTGRTPIVLEGFMPQDTNWLNGGFVLGINSLGSWLPFRVYILAFRPKNSGNAFGGLNVNKYSLNSGFILGDPQNNVFVSDDDIYAAVKYVHSAGIITKTYIFD